MMKYIFGLLMTIMLVGYMPPTPSDEVILYRTYEDFNAEKGENVGEYLRTFTLFGQRHTHTFRKDEVKTKVKKGEAWGFKYKEGYFRFSRDGNYMARIISVGNIILYANGSAHMEMLQKGTKTAFADDTWYHYVSKDLESDVVPIAGKNWRRFRKKHANRYKVLFACTKGKVNRRVRCILDYNEKDEESN